MPNTLYLESNNAVWLKSLVYTEDDSPVLDATVRVTVYDNDNEEVAGNLWPVTMTHTADGNYRGTLESTIELTDNRQYTAKVVAVTPDGNQKTWICEAVAAWDC